MTIILIALAAAVVVGYIWYHGHVHIQIHELLTDIHDLLLSIENRLGGGPPGVG